MRIRHLDLIRIGPFTNQKLSFDKGEFGLHLVYGSNEAGKSSTLRALSQWLFGIPGETKSRDQFVHTHKDLRVGGTIENHEGQTLTCVRRSGGKKTSLKGENDKGTLDPAVLTSFLSGLTQEQFQTQFGIDLHQLVAGGKTIASGGGELGESLFAAGSGSANMPLLRKSLESQCEDLFKASSASKPKVNAAISAFTAARTQVRDVSVKSNDWQRQSDELDDLRRQKAELDEQQLERRGQRDRLHRILKALPSIGTWKDRQHELAAVGEVVRLPSDFATRRVAIAESLAAATASRKTTADELESLNAKLSELGEPPKILNHASAVELLYENLSLYRQTSRTLPGRTAEYQQTESRAKSLLRTLGKEPDLDNADGLRINPAVRAKIRDLADQRSGLLTAIDQTNREFERRTKELDTLIESINRLDTPEDPRPLKKAISAAQKTGDLDSRVDQLAQSLASQRSQSLTDVSRLPMWIGGIDDLVDRPVPTSETVLAFADRFETNAHAITRLDADIRKFEDELARGREDLHALTLNQDVPTEEQLGQARQARDDAWTTIHQSVRSGAVDGNPTTIDDFQAHLKACDEIADRLRREAQSVSEKARLIAVIRRCETQIIERVNDRRKNETERTELSERWLDIWRHAGLQMRPGDQTPTPNEMKGWLTRYDALMTAATEMTRLASELGCEQQRRDHHIDSLIAVVPDAISSINDRPERLGPLLDACVDRLDQLSTSISDAKQSRSHQKSLTQVRSMAESEWHEAQEAKSVWQTQWDTAMVAIESDGSLTASEAQAVLETIDSLMKEIDDAAKLRDDVQLQNVEIENYESQVRTLLPRLSEEPGGCDDSINVEAIVGQWHDELKQARRNETTRDEWLSQKTKLEKQHRTAAAKIESDLANLSHMCVEAGCESPDRLPEIEQQAMRRRTIEQSLAEVQSELRGLAQGVELETFIAEAMAEDADRLSPQIEQLDEMLEQTEKRRSELSETIGNQKGELERIDGNDKAAEANERAEEALARARTHAEDYIRAKLGSILLRTAVTRYRQRNQGPILMRASELFARFTLGSFSGLETESTDVQDNVLVGVRGDDPTKLVHVDEMSEGTCDQLFLSLRLASLEVYLQSNPPFPLIVDDILSNFDDARSAATLTALGELSMKTQVIVFTHHRHLIDLAKDNLSDNVLFTHSLDGPAIGSDADEKRRPAKSRSPQRALRSKKTVSNSPSGQLFE